jgi:hypothetical protein
VLRALQEISETILASDRQHAVDDFAENNVLIVKPDEE